MNCLKVAVIAAAVVSCSAMAIPVPQFGWGSSPQTTNIYQQGVLNSAQTSQSGADGSSISINQFGSSNHAMPVNQSMGDSTITLTQNGYNNGAELAQNGKNKWASMTVHQYGALNDANVTQSSTGAVANVTQVGYHNNALVQQN